MASDTVTTITTISDYIAPLESFTTTTTTTTTHIWTTIIAAPGETMTVGQPLPYAASSFKYTPTFTPTQTFTVTKYEVWLLGPQGNAWTETIIDTSSTGLGIFNPQYPPGETVFIVPYPCSGWSCWSPGQKVGLIIGVVFGAIFLLLLLCCLRRWHKRKIWISHGAHGANNYERWQNSHPDWGYYWPPRANLQTVWGLRPYVTPAPAPAGEAKKEESKEPAKETRQKFEARIAG